MINCNNFGIAAKCSDLIGVLPIFSAYSENLVSEKNFIFHDNSNYHLEIMKIAWVLKEPFDFWF